MSELRYRPPETVPAADRSQLPDSPRQPDRQDAPDAHHARDDVTRYDADAQFKHPVAKPDGYLPDDTGGTAQAPATRRERGDWSVRRDDPDLAWRKDPADAPALTELTETDHADALQVMVDRPEFHVATDDRSPDR